MGWISDPNNLSTVRIPQKFLFPAAPPIPPGGPEILLLHFDVLQAGTFYDSSPLHQNITNAGVAVDNVTFLFPTGSGGPTGLLTPLHPTAWSDLWTGDFTVEFAILPQVIGEMAILGNVDDGAQTGAWIRVFASDPFGTGIRASSIGIEGYDNTGGGVSISFGTIVDLPGQLLRLCVMKTGADIWLFSEGLSVLNATLPFNLSPGVTPFGIYADSIAGGRPTNALLDEMRVTKQALYPTTGYVVSPIPFPDSP